MNAFNTPFLLGFDEFEEMLDRLSKNADGFPPYNIEQLPDGHLRIVLAVAGYQESDLEITLEDKQLVIRGHQNQSIEKHYLHRGIAARNFLKSFVLANDIKIQGAHLENGLLQIDLARPQKKTSIQKIEIQSSAHTVVLDAGGKK